MYIGNQNCYNLKTKICQDNSTTCYDFLINRKGYRISKEDQGFINEIKHSFNRDII